MLLAAGAPGVARGDSLTLHLEPSYYVTDTRTRNAAGATDTGENRLYVGTYQLALQKELYESIGLRASLTLLDSHGSATMNRLSLGTQDALTWTGDATLGFGQGLLTGALQYSRNDISGRSRRSTDPFVRVQPSIVRETTAASFTWAPVDLPTLDGRISRDSTQAVGIDQTGLIAGLTSTYQPIEHVRLAGSVGYNQGTDHVTDVETANVSESATATYTQTFSERTAVHAQGQLSHTSGSVRTGPASGPVRTPRPVVEGLSLVEGLTDLPERDTLQTNALLIDGDTAGGAGLNIGWGPSLTGDQALRDAGVRFVELDPVSLIEVWVDEQLPPDVASAYAWSVYRSDDNLTWTAVTVTGPVVFNTAWSRFEVQISATRTRYLKVATRPISTAVTPDPRFRDVAITELRTFLLESPEDVRGRSSAVSATLNGAVGTRLLDKPNLRYDLAASLNSSDWKSPFWFVTNALSVSGRLGRKTTASANVLRSDSGGELGRDWRTQYGASLAAAPVPTLNTGASFSGFFSRAGSRGNAASIFSRATLYRGVDVSANGGYSISTAPDHRRIEGSTVSASTSLTPTGRITLTGGALTSWTRASGGAEAATSARTSRLDGNIGLIPFPALYLSAGVSRLIQSSAPPKTIASAAVTYSPLRDGALLLSLAHSENYDTGTETRNRSSTAALRWNFIATGFAEASYAFNRSASPQTAMDSQLIGARLGLTL